MRCICDNFRNARSNDHAIVPIKTLAAHKVREGADIPAQLTTLHSCGAQAAQVTPLRKKKIHVFPKESKRIPIRISEFDLMEFILPRLLQWIVAVSLRYVKRCNSHFCFGHAYQPVVEVSFAGLWHRTEGATVLNLTVI